MRNYLGAAEDYEHYFKIAPANWAGINDYAWVLLKANLPHDALAALNFGLKQWPDNPWLLNNKTTALYELGRFAEAAQTATKATDAVQQVGIFDWLMAYPGNDPSIAPEGVAQFKKAVADNQRLVQAAILKKGK
jgi:tetratricopeptide (TPR) repeat protein